MKYFKRFFFVPILLIIFIVLFYALYEEVKNKTITQFNSEQLFIAKTASQGISDYINSYLSELTFLSNFPDVINFNERGKEILKTFYENRKLQIEALTRIDARGTILNTYPENKNAIGANITYQDHINKLINLKKVVISDVFTSIQGYLAIAIHVPVFKGNEFRGSIAILIAIDKIGKRYLENITNTNKSYAILLSEDNIELYCPNPNHIGKSIVEASKNDSSVFYLINKIKIANSGFESFYHDKNKIPDNDKKSVIFYRIPLEDTYWTVLITIPQEEVYKTISGFQNRLILLFSLLMVILLIYFYFFTKARNVIRAEAKRNIVEKALTESEAYNRALFNQSPIGLALTTMDGQLVDINDAFAKIIGRTIEETLQLSYWDITPEKYMEQEQQKLDSLKSIGYYYPYEKEYIHKDGHLVPVRLQGLIIEKDGLPHIWSSVEDITERKEAEETLRYNQELLHEMGKVAKIGGWEFDPVTGNGTWTEEVAKIHDLDPNDKTNAEIGLSFYKDDSKLRIEHAIKEAIEKGKPYNIEAELITAKGEFKWVHTIGYPTFKNGKIIKIRGSFQDITEQKQAEKKIKELNETLEQKVIERTQDLEQKIKEIKRMNKLFINRELRMKELKQTISELEAKQHKRNTNNK